MTETSDQRYEISVFGSRESGLPVVRADGVQDVLDTILPLQPLLALIDHR